MKLGVVVAYSSIDSFLWPLLKAQVEAIADHAVVVRRTALFGGDPEPMDNLGMHTLTLPKGNGQSARDLIHEMRVCGIESLPMSTTHVLLLDSDELFDVDALSGAVESQPIYFAANWYWRSGSVRAIQHNEVAGLLCPRDKLVLDAKRGERETMAQNIARPRPQQPFMHHYSWCKPIDAMLKKVRNWGHRGDRNWESDLVHEWKSPLPGHCFVHRRVLERCPDVFGIGTP